MSSPLFQKPKKIGFYRPNKPYGEFSNWYETTIFINNTKFISSEQAFMYYKAILFGDNATALRILESKSQKQIKALGRQVANFDQQRWDNIKFNLMVKVNYYKFIEDPNLKYLLLETGDAYIYEDSPYDAIWGVGPKGDGQNLLGLALMKVRSWILEETTYEESYEDLDCLVDELPD